MKKIARIRTGGQASKRGNKKANMVVKNLTRKGRFLRCVVATTAKGPRLAGRLAELLARREGGAT